MRKLFIWLTATVLMGLTANAQEFFEYDAPVPDSVPKSNGQRSYYGNDHTPKGHLHVLYVCVQFEQDIKTNTTWPLNSLPNWHNRLFYESMNEFTDTATDLSLSNYYYQNSKFGDDPFYVTGEFADLVKVPASGGYPSSHNSEVFAQLAEQYPDKDWSDFDLRTNHTSSQVYKTDNSNTSPDGNFDYVVVQYRVFDSVWYEDVGLTQPGHTAVANCYSGTVTSSQGTWQVNGDGHTHFSKLGFMTARDLFLHEMAHNLYIYGHYGYANGVPGDHMHMTLFWSMMRSNMYMMDASCAWERYMLKWLDIKHDIDENTDTRNPFIIEDFATTGDALRIEIPNTDEHLWIEYHKGDSYLDKRHRLTGTGSVDFPQPIGGVYAYVEGLWADRESNFHGNVELNGAKVINGAGYYKYWHNDTAIKYPGYWWPKLYTYNQIDNKPQPYGGFAQNTDYVDDYNQDNRIDYSTGSQSGSLERGNILREGPSEAEGEFTYNFLSGNTAPLEEGKIYSAFSNPPIINHAHLDNQEELGYLKLHGLRVWFFKQNDEIWVHVNYDNEIKEPVTFTNKILIPSNETIKIKDGVDIYMEKGKVANRVGEHTDGFIANSSFTIDSYGTLEIVTGSSFSLKDDSELILKNNSILKLEGIVSIESEGKVYCDGNASIESPNENGYIQLDGKIVVASSDNLYIGPGVNIGGNEQEGEILVRGTLHLTNQQLENLDLEIKNGGKLIIEDAVTFAPNSSLTLFEGSTVEGNSSASSLTILGNLNHINNVTFTNLSNNNSGGLIIDNDYSVNINNSSFQNSSLTAHMYFADIFIDSTSFNNSAVNIDLISDHNTGLCKITQNHFTGSTAEEALRIDNYVMFNIEYNVIENNDGNGLAIYNLGSANLPARSVKWNIIRNNNVNPKAKGLLLYATIADVMHNEIYNNTYGVALYHNSEVKMEGDSFFSTQKIYNNNINQIRSADNSFPWYLKWNVIDDVENKYPRIYCKVSPFGGEEMRLDARDNCWGDNFNPQNELYPYDRFIYLPVWNCMQYEGSGTQNEPRLAYESALIDIEDQNYQVANNKLKMIVANWPSSDYATSALKTMPAVAVQLNELNTLENYFITNDIVQNNPDLKLLAGYLVADIDVLQEDYQSALDYYAQVISDPPSPEDSIYAVIDAGNAIYLMEGGGKTASANFKYREIIPITKAAFKAKRKVLLDEIGENPVVVDEITEEPVEKDNSENDGAIPDLSESKVNIYPNPAKESLNVACNLSDPGKLVVQIYNITGTLVKNALIDAEHPGTNKTKINIKDLTQGIYFIKIDQNHTTLHTQSIVVN